MTGCVCVCVWRGGVVPRVHPAVRARVLGLPDLDAHKLRKVL